MARMARIRRHNRGHGKPHELGLEFGAYVEAFLTLRVRYVVLVTLAVTWTWKVCVNPHAKADHWTERSRYWTAVCAMKLGTPA